MPREYKVSFEVSGIPDSIGLRIKSTDPTGLYSSSKNAEAAQWYFETTVISLLVDRGLFGYKLWTHGGICLDKELDWPALIAAGSGELVVRTMTGPEVADATRNRWHVTVPPVQPLATMWWKNPAGRSVCIITDDRNSIERWLVDSMQADLVRTSAH